MLCLPPCRDGCIKLMIMHIPFYILLNETGGIWPATSLLQSTNSVHADHIQNTWLFILYLVFQEYVG